MSQPTKPTPKPKSTPKSTPKSASGGSGGHRVVFGDPSTGREIEGEISLSVSSSGRFIVNSMTLFGPDENGLEPADFQLIGRGLHRHLVDLADAIANNVRPTGDPSMPFEFIENDNPFDIWLFHLQTVVPGREGESKAQWIARVWREYYEPTGRSMKDLATDLGLAHVTVRGYCSQEDPTRSKSAKKVSKRGQA